MKGEVIEMQKVDAPDERQPDFVRIETTLERLVEKTATIVRNTMELRDALIGTEPGKTEKGEHEPKPPEENTLVNRLSNNLRDLDIRLSHLGNNIDKIRAETNLKNDEAR